MALPDVHNIDDLDKFILTEFPQPIAVNYKRLLNIDDWEKKVKQCLHVFEFSLRTMVLALISQYLIRDANNVNDPGLNKLLLDKLPGKASLGTWQQLFFSTLRAYEGKRELFFMPELYDFYWDTSKEVLKPKKGIENNFTRLVQIRNDLAHRLGPNTEERWKNLFQEAFTHLRSILSCFKFIENYELIRILVKRDNQYEYMVCKGLETVFKSDLPSDISELEVGWFYISKNNRSFLQLHPLLIFWEEGEKSSISEKELQITTDAAIYDSFSKEAVNYLATILWKVVSDKRTVADFIRLLYYTVQEIKTSWRKVSKLTWSILKDISIEINDAQTSGAKGKYDKDLYVQRSDLVNIFYGFLKSRQNCFVLLGKSGVGKSSFYLSLLDSDQFEEETCVLYYDGAIMDTENPLEETLTKEFKRKLRLASSETETSIDDIIFEISKIEQIHSKKLLLLIDGINENPNASDLLLRIDTFLRNNPFPWLKVALSSRPEAWQVINRGVKSLAIDRYYLVENQTSIGYELEEFIYSELSEAYSKYKTFHNVLSDLDKLSGKVKSILRDPLALKLVMETNKGRKIPSNLSHAQIIHDYIGMLSETKRLLSEDVYLLKYEIMPLMLDESNYSNTVTAQQVNTSITKDKRSLRELITSDDLLSNGKRVNSSFVNLADAEILSLIGDPIEYEIVFKYERFFDYYAGQHIFDLNKTKLDKTVFYLSLMKEVNEKVFLWGAIKHAINLEFTQDPQAGQNLLITLAQNKDKTIRDLIVSILIYMGEEDSLEIEKILQSFSILGIDKVLDKYKASITNLLDYIRMARGLPSHSSNSEELARSIVPIVAGRLQLSDLLANSVSDPSAVVRKEAADALYVHWRACKINNDIDKSYDPIKKIAQKTATSRYAIPNIDHLVCLLDVTSKLLINHIMTEGDAVAPLLPIWRNVLENLPLVLPAPNNFIGRINNFIRNKLLLPWLGNRLEDVVKSSLTEMHPINFRIINNWYKLPENEKEEWRRFISYGDTDRYSLDEIKLSLVELSSDERPLFAVLIAMILPLHAINHFEEVMNLTYEMINTGNNRSINIVLRTYEVLGEVIAAKNRDYLHLVIQKSQEITLEVWKKLQNCFVEARFDALSWPLFLNLLTEDQGPIKFAYDLVASIPVDVSADEKRSRMIDLIHAIGTFSLSNQSFGRDIETMAGWLSIDDPVIREELAKEIAKVYLVFPSRVADILAKSEHGPEFLQTVERIASSENTRSAAGQSAGGLLYALFSNPILKRDWMLFLRDDFGGSPNFNNAVQKASDRIIHMIYELENAYK